MAVYSQRGRKRVYADILNGKGVKRNENETHTLCLTPNPAGYAEMFNVKGKRICQDHGVCVWLSYIPANCPKMLGQSQIC